MRRTLACFFPLVVLTFGFLPALQIFAQEPTSGTAVIFGRVVDEEKRTPVEGVVIEFIPGNSRVQDWSHGMTGSFIMPAPPDLRGLPKLLQSTTTDRDGRFRAQVAGEDGWVVYARSPAHAHAGRRILLGAGADSVECNFALGKPVTMQGYVRSEKREAIDGATVVMYAKVPLWQPPCVGTTDKEGHFKIDNLPAYSLQGFALAKGYAPAVRQTIHPAVPSLGFSLQELGKVIVAARKPDGARANDFAVTVLQIAGNTEVDITAQLSPTRSGESIVEVQLWPGNYVVFVTESSFAPSEERRLYIEPGGVVKLDFALRDVHEVSGKVVSSPGGKPVSDATVRMLYPLGVSSARTDRKGNFKFAGVPAGAVVIDICADGWARRRVSSLTVARGKNLDAGTIELARGAVVQGTVKDQKGEPMPACRVMLDGPAGRFDVRFTDNVGRFRFGELETGRYGICAGGEDYGFMRSLVLDVAGEGSTCETKIVAWDFAGGKPEVIRKFDSEDFKRTPVIDYRITLFEYAFPAGKKGAECRGFYMLFSNEYGAMEIPTFAFGDSSFVRHATYDYGPIVVSRLVLPAVAYTGEGGTLHHKPERSDILAGWVGCDGEPLPNVEIHAYVSRSEPGKDGKARTNILTQRAVSSSLGTFGLVAVLPNIPQSLFHIVASRPGYVCEPVELKYEEVLKLALATMKGEVKPMDKEGIRFDMRRAPTGSLLVRVRKQDGRPARAFVVLRDAEGKPLGMSSTTDHGGATCFLALKPAVYVVLAEVEEPDAKCVEQKATVEASTESIVDLIVE